MTDLAAVQRPGDPLAQPTDLTAEQVAQRIASAIEGDYPEVLLIAHVDSDPTVVWVKATDNDGVTREFRLTVEAQP
ncbi:hypothetical protein [Micromonospora sp. DPT]|uniref:hypothetical protein n=1 Tax=Micromonospora sp. DPT TaxID=3142975 RepID=UPI00320A1BD1